MLVVVYTDGLQHAGSLSGTITFDPIAAIKEMHAEGDWDAQLVADLLLNQAVELDSGRPRDDISVMVATVTEKLGDDSRRLNGRFPL